MQNVVPDSFILFLEQIEGKKSALIHHLLHLYRVFLEFGSLPKVREEFEWYAKQERDLTQEIDLTAEPTKEEMISQLMERRRETLKGLPFQELADIATFLDKV